MDVVVGVETRSPEIADDHDDVDDDTEADEQGHRHQCCACQQH